MEKMIQHSTELPADTHSPTSYWHWFGPLLYMVVVGLYFVARYSGRWAEADSAWLTDYIRVFAREGRLLNSRVYPNGYAFQSISTFILALTGLDVATLQQIVYPVAASMVVLPAWVVYREFTGSTRGATLTTLLLFTQPEFLFMILRSSHEKFTRTLMLLCLFVLVRSFKALDRPWLLATNVGLFYLAAFSLIASNNLLAHSFIFALAIALLLGWLLSKRNVILRQQSNYIFRRLSYATLICLGLAYIFPFYLYQPAQHDLLILQNIGDRIGALFLDVQTQASNPYTQVEAAWVEPVYSVYFMLSIANWIILATSLIIWVHQGLRWLWSDKMPETQVAWLLWLFYAAFAAQGALSIITDFSGVLSSNLQHRLFPSFSTIAVGVVGAALVRWRPRRHPRLIQLGLSVGIFCIAILSITKAINDPAVSNKWTFYQPSELAVLEWSDTHLKSAEIWTEYDERLAAAFVTIRGDSANNNQFRYGMPPSMRNIILTAVTRLRGSRLHQPLPVPPDALQVYDNGEAGLYHLRPRTPYQQ
jgi:hypothetical protein